MSIPNENDVDWGKVYEALAHGRRREFLRHLANTTETVTMDEAVAHILSLDGEGGEQATVAGELYHVHLPKLVDAGLLTWDQDADEIELTPLGLSLPVGIVVPRSPNLEQAATGERAGD